MNLTTKQKRLLTQTLCGLFVINAYSTATAEEDTHWRQSQLDSEYKGSTAFIGDGKNSIGYLQIKPVTTRLYADNSVKREVSTTLGFSQDLGNQALHFSSNFSPENHSLNFGTTIANTTLSVSSGSGSENAWLANDGIATTNRFQQGFSPAKYRYQGANLHHQVNNALGFNASSINIDLDGRVNPSVYTAGMNWQGLSANLLSTRRNNTTIGKGLALAYNHNKFDSSFEQFSDVNNFTIRTAQFFYNAGKKGIVGLQLTSGHSPFNGVADSSMMLTYKKRWGHPSYNQLASTSGNSTVKGHGAFNKNVLLGLGAAAGLAAAVGSSSNNGDGSSGGFATQHSAAQNILNSINPTSVNENVEYGGWVTLSTDTTYATTSPLKGSIASVDIGAKPSNATASYHTHAGPDPQYDNENFSPQDLLSDRLANVDGYLGTPAGQFKYHNLSTGEVSTLGTIAN